MTADHRTFSTRFTAALFFVLLARPSVATAQLDDRRVIGAEARVVGCPGGDQRDQRDQARGVVVALDTARMIVRSAVARELPVSQLRSIEIRTRESHLIAGGAIGVVLGYAIGYAISKPSETDLRASDGLAAIQQPLIGIVGGLVGGGIGLATTRARWTSVALPAGAGRECVAP